MRIDTTLTSAAIAHAPSAFEAIFRAAVADGTATTLIADRVADPEMYDARVVRITTIKALRTVEADRLGEEGYRAEYPKGITLEGVRAMGLDPKAPAKGDLRRKYLRIKG